MLLRSTSLFCLLTGIGCNKADPNAEQSETQNTSQPQPVSVLLPWGFGIQEAQFAVLPNGNIGGATLGPPGSTSYQPIRIEFAIADDSASTQGVTEENTCLIVAEIPGELSPDPALAAEVGALLAVPIPFEEATLSGCEDMVLPANWGSATGLLASWQWYIGVSALTSQGAEELQSLYGEQWEDLAGYAGGGGYRWEGMLQPSVTDDYPGAWIGNSVTWAYQVDEANTQVYEGDWAVLLESKDYAVEGLIPGFYEVQTRTLLTPAKMLLEL